MDIYLLKAFFIKTKFSVKNIKKTINLEYKLSDIHIDNRKTDVTSDKTRLIKKMKFKSIEYAIIVIFKFLNRRN